MIKKNKNFADFEEEIAVSPIKSKKIPSARSRFIPDGYLVPIMILLTVAAVFAVSLIILPRVVVYDIGAVSDANGVVTDGSSDGESEDGDIRIFREYGGRVGVFNESGELDFVIDVPVSSLPDYDRRLIASGVIAQGAEQIAAMKEALSP